MADDLPAAFAATRHSLHRVAEHVLAAVLHQSTGRIGLRPTPDGFGTPRFERRGVAVQVRIEGIALVVAEGSTERRVPLTTIAEAAEFVGIEPGGPAGVYPLVTPVEADVALALDADSARIISEWLAVTTNALDQFRTTHAGLGPSVAQLWPEHLDLAITLGEVNYGASPGDAGHAAPYAYVGPWRPDTVTGEFWNAPFGARRSHAEFPTVDPLIEFFETGRRLAAAS